jgi:phosphoserine phosphatase
MQRVEPILVFDLDGTVLRINSFPVWVAFLALGGPRGLSMGQQLKVTALAARLVMLRKLGQINHTVLMRRTQELWQFATAGDGGAAAQLLAKLLSRTTRHNLDPAIKLVSEGALDGVLATAAAEDYAVALGQRLGLQNVLATRTGRAMDEPENSGVHKRDRLQAWLDARGWSGRPLIFFNDHLADLPLMRECSIVCWVGSRRALKQAQRDVTNVRFVDCRKMNAREMRATIAHLYQSASVARMQDQATGSRANTFA